MCASRSMEPTAHHFLIHWSRSKIDEGEARQSRFLKARAFISSVHPTMTNPLRATSADEEFCEVPNGAPPHKIEDWKTAVSVLQGLLASEGGSVSSITLRRDLQRRGIANAKDLVLKLRFFDFAGEADPTMPRPDFKFYHRGRSFYSEQAFREVEAETEAQAEEAGSTATIERLPDEDAETESPRRSSRQEEARLITYVKTALEGLYDSEFRPERAPFVFDVHNSRAGSDFENVDLLAFHWRSPDIVDTVTVEVKLDFTARLVQQANNYRRFSNRVWLAVVCNSPASDAADELRETDPLLFDYILDLGIGILGCRRTRGRSYEVSALQWPRLLIAEPLERDMFVERQRPTFEDAGIVPRDRTRFPRLR